MVFNKYIQEDALYIPAISSNAFEKNKRRKNQHFFSKDHSILMHVQICCLCIVDSRNKVFEYMKEC